MEERVFYSSKWKTSPLSSSLHSLTDHAKETKLVVEQAGPSLSKRGEILQAIARYSTF